jgi:hypothetical protein
MSLWPRRRFLVSSAAADAFSLLPEHMTQLPKQPSNYRVSRMATTHADRNPPLSTSISQGRPRGPPAAL